MINGFAKVVRKSAKIRDHLENVAEGVGIKMYSLRSLQTARMIRSRTTAVASFILNSPAILHADAMDKLQPKIQVTYNKCRSHCSSTHQLSGEPFPKGFGERCDRCCRSESSSTSDSTSSSWASSSDSDSDIVDEAQEQAQRVAQTIAQREVVPTVPKPNEDVSDDNDQPMETTVEEAALAVDKLWDWFLGAVPKSLVQYRKCLEDDGFDNVHALTLLRPNDFVRYKMPLGHRAQLKH